jgi:hypothetical protein
MHNDDTPLEVTAYHEAGHIVLYEGIEGKRKKQLDGRIAVVVVFLARDGASYLTATTIFTDGGMMQNSPGL